MNSGDRRISAADIEKIIYVIAAELMASLNEPMPPFENHSPAKLEGALAAPFQSAFEEDIYKDVFEKAAALFYFVAKDHAFENGNKRVAVVTLLYYLGLNDIGIQIGAKELYRIAVWAVEATHSMEKVIRVLSGELRNHSLPYEEWIRSSKEGDQPSGSWEKVA